jgi:hypothetical protein
MPGKTPWTATAFPFDRADSVWGHALANNLSIWGRIPAIESWFSGSFVTSARIWNSVRSSVMKRLCSLEDIRAEMQRRIGTSAWGNGYCSAPTPYRIPYDGVANWTAHVGATEGFLLGIVAAVRAEYELKPESLTEAPSPAFLADPSERSRS